MKQKYIDNYQNLNSRIYFHDSVSIHIMRHGESVNNAKKLITGSQNVPLTPLGRKQAKEASRKLASFYDIAFTSPLDRSQDTLGIALSEHNIQVGHIMKPDEKIAERNLGVIEGTHARFIPEYAEGDLLFAPDGGESYLDLSRRIFCFLEELAKLVNSQKLTSVLISSHMGPMRIFSAIFEENNDPCSILRSKYNSAHVLKYKKSKIKLPRCLSKTVQKRKQAPMHIAESGQSMIFLSESIMQ